MLRDCIARGCPATSLEAAQAWRSEHIAGAKRPPADSSDRNALELAILAEKLEKERTANRVRKGELVPLAEIERRFRRHIFAARAIFGQLPQRLAKIQTDGGGRRAAGRIRAAAKRMIDAACIQLEEALTREAEEAESTEPPSKESE